MQLTKRHLLAVGAMVLQIGFLSTAKADLVGYWPLDEAADVEGVPSTPDLAPTKGPHNGVLVGDAEIIEDPLGERGNVLNLGEFNNGAGVDLPTFPQDERSDAGINEDLGPGFIAISGSGDTGLPDIEGTQEVTISYWINRLEDPATSQWTFLFQDGGNRQLGTHAPWGDGVVYFDVSGCCGGNQRISTSMNGADTDGQWHHLAYVKKKNPDESDMAITAIFQDGVPIVASPGCDVDCWANGATDDLVDWGAATIDDVVPITTAAFGAAPGGGSSNNGLMDDFAIWDEALSTERIVGLANGSGVIPIAEGETLGDFNSDGAIDTADFLIIAENFNTDSTLAEAFFKGDMDGNLRINLKDFLAFRGLFESLPAAGGAVAASVPEPGVGTLLGIAALSLLVWRRRFS